MSSNSTHRLLIAGLAAAFVINAPQVGAQESADPSASPTLTEAETIPPIIVVTPSPIAKKVVKKKPVQSQQAAPAPLETEIVVPATQQPQPGTLVVIDDAFVPVTVAGEHDIRSNLGANIADSLDLKPGINGSTFAPGANRPIIRGLDNFRVRVQENGIGSHDVSALSEDHAVAIDPFSASRVEVIRGPATLRYGSQAIGGVVAVENDRIPTALPEHGFALKAVGGLNSVNDGEDGAIQLTAGLKHIAFHASSFARRTEDYDTPNGNQFNTFVEAEGYAVGGSIIKQNGFIGVAISRYASLYGVPGEEAEELMPKIDLSQDRIQAKGEWRIDSHGLEAIRFWFGASDYEHKEIVDEGEGSEIGQRFTTEVYETRAEVQHSPIPTRFGQLSGALGLQYVESNTRGQSFEGDSLLDPTKTDAIAAFWFEELEVSKKVTLQTASRIEYTEIDGRGRISPLDPLVDPTNFNLDFTTYSGSLGLLYRLPGGPVFSLVGQYVERAPADAELFSAGIHEATETFEIGNPSLSKEKAKTIEVGLRKKDGPLRYDATAFYTNFDGFIFKDLTGAECNETLASCGDPEPGEEPLDQVLFDQRDATFYGVELAAQYDVAPLWRGVWGIEGQYDFVRAEFDEGGNVPRIPPHRLGGGIYYRDQHTLARIGVLHAFKQDKIGANEIETPGYTLVSAELSHTVSRKNKQGLGPEMTFGLKGENLADEEVLNHASFKRRQDVLLPGANIRAFATIKLN